MINEFYKRRQSIVLNRIVWEECTPEEWDKEMESTREFINFGNGFTYARKRRKD